MFIEVSFFIFTISLYSLIWLCEYKLNVLYSEKSNDSQKDYRKDWVIGEGFFHTFADIESAKDFVVYLTQRINNKELTKKPELYKLPTNANLVILNAIIPKGSLYYEWPYKAYGPEIHRGMGKIPAKRRLKIKLYIWIFSVNKKRLWKHSLLSFRVWKRMEEKNNPNI